MYRPWPLPSSRSLPLLPLLLSLTLAVADDSALAAALSGKAPCAADHATVCNISWLAAQGRPTRQSVCIAATGAAVRWRQTAAGVLCACSIRAAASVQHPRSSIRVSMQSPNKW